MVPTLIYSQHSGIMTLNGKFLFTGYAGKDDGKNNPAMQCVKGVGPLPQGFYTLAYVKNGGHTGPYSIALTPDDRNVMFGRGDFFIHGDSISVPGTASNGCIIKSPQLFRVKCWTNSNRLLQVIE